MVVDALYIALVISNLLLLAACHLFGPRIRLVATVGILINGVALVIFLIPLVTLLFDSRAPAEAPVAIRILLPATAVLAAQLIALVVAFRRKVCPKP